MRVFKYVTALAAVSLAMVSPAFAQDGGGLISTDGMKALALSIAVAAGVMAQCKVISSALESISRNPGAAGELRQPWFLALAFIESLVILTWLYSAKFVG